jgi:hypothetical protein
MGMFDYLYWKDSLPLEYQGEKINLDTLFKGAEEKYFQTKSLDNTMGLYIVENKQLYIEKVEKEWIEDESSEIFGGYFHDISRDCFEYNVTTTIDFYHYVNDYDDKNDAWVEYQAVIIKGRVDSVVLVKFEKQLNEVRKLQETKFKNHVLKEKSLESKRYFVFIKLVRSIRRVLARLIRKIGNLIGQIGNSLIRFSYKIH